MQSALAQGHAHTAADMAVSLVVDVATGVRQKIVLFLQRVYELVLRMIADCFAFGYESPGQRQIRAHVEAV